MYGENTKYHSNPYIQYPTSDILPYIYFTVALRANVKPAHCKFKVAHSVSQFYARLRFSATRDTTSSTDNRCPAALQRCQRLLNGTSYGYLRVTHRPAMCVSLPMNASCSASVLPSTHGYAYRACDTSTTASRIAPARPKMLSIALVAERISARQLIRVHISANTYVRT